MSDLNTIHKALALTPHANYVGSTVAVAGHLGDKNEMPDAPNKHLYVRLNEVQLLSNFDGIFDRNNEVRLIAVTIDSNQEKPIHFTTPAVFPRVRPQERLQLGNSGLGLYYTETPKLPNYVSIHLLVVEDDSDVREFGKAVTQVRALPEYKAIFDAAKMLTTIASPAYGTALMVGEALIGLVAKILEQNKDDLIAYFAATYTRMFDGLGEGHHSFHKADGARVRYEILMKDSITDLPQTLHP